VRDGWLRETSVLARIFIKHGMASMAGRMARGPARMKLKHKGRKSWQELLGRLPQHSGQGMSHTMGRCQDLRPSMDDLRDQPAEIATPVLLAVGDEDMRCLNTNLMYQTAFALNLALQVVAWIWFMFPRVTTDSRQRPTREPCSNLRPGRRCV
jgi:hypothetical protein